MLSNPCMCAVSAGVGQFNSNGLSLRIAKHKYAVTWNGNLGILLYAVRYLRQ